MSLNSSFVRSGIHIQHFLRGGRWKARSGGAHSSSSSEHSIFNVPRPSPTNRPTDGENTFDNMYFPKFTEISPPLFYSLLSLFHLKLTFPEGTLLFSFLLFLPSLSLNLSFSPPPIFQPSFLRLFIFWAGGGRLHCYTPPPPLLQ